MNREFPHARALRRGRVSRPGYFYFLTTTVADRRSIFRDAVRAGIVLDTLRWLRCKGRLLTDAAVVMPDHVHIAGQLGNHDLPAVMHSLKSYSGHQLRMLGIRPPVWQSGYHDHQLRDDEDYRLRVRYLLENPVRAGLVANAEDYAYRIVPHWL